MAVVFAMAATEVMALQLVIRAVAVVAAVTAVVLVALYCLLMGLALGAEAVLDWLFLLACQQALHMFLHQDRQEAILSRAVKPKSRYMLITY